MLSAKIMRKKNYSFWLAVGLILIASFSRLIPHPPNFTPLTGIALFGGKNFSSKIMAFLVPLLALFITDLVLGFHSTMPYVYGAFILTVLLGMLLKNNFNYTKLLGLSLSSSTLFFIITNFGVWVHGSFYAKTLDGLLLCYAAALPFYQWSLLGDLFYSAALFGIYQFASKKITALQTAKA
jgi:hypothetical protein